MTTAVPHLVVTLAALAVPAGSYVAWADRPAPVAPERAAPAPAPAPVDGARPPGPAPREAAPVGVWPVQPPPEVLGGFAPPPSRYASGHRGVDLAAAPGQEVVSALPGRVTFASNIAGRGVVVVVHGDIRTTYEPVRATVGVGAAVQAGDRIGVLEAVPGHCAPRSCLHWGLLRGDAYLDPLTLVGAGPVRLLPWKGLPHR